MPDAVLIESERGVLRLTLHRPNQMNSLDTAVLEGLAAGIARAADDPAVRVVLIGGAGRAFCAGADLIEAGGLIEQGGPAFGEWLGLWRTTFDAFEACSKPVIAVVGGAALAGGLELALACDLIVASSRATFGDVHARFGLVPGGGGSQRLVDAVGTRTARWLMYSGAQISASEAHRIGLVQTVFDAETFDADVAALSTTLAGRSVASTQFMKRMSRSSHVTADGLDRELAEAAALVAGPDAREGFAAFSEKREPRFPSVQDGG